MSAALNDVDSDLEALTQFLYIAPIGLVQISLGGEIQMINPMSAQLLLPLSCDGELENLFDVLGTVAPDLQAQALAYPHAHGMVCDSIPLQVDAGLPGRRDPRILSLSLLKLDQDRLMAVVNDVTASVQRDRLLQLSQSWIHTILAGIEDYALLSLDTEGRVHDWNPSIGRVTGFDPAQTVGQSFAMFCPPDTLPQGRVQDRLHEARESGWSLEEGWRQRADGSNFWGSCLIAPLETGHATGPGEAAYSLIIRDISDRREALEAMRRSVACDFLTGLPNRRAFFEIASVELQRWHRSPRPLALVVIDADHFKAVNDTHGHAAGDAVLRHLAVCLGSTFRAVDTVARIGGEEFAVVLPGATLDAARAVAQRLCDTVARSAVTVDGVSISYTVSAGIAAMSPAAEGLDTLLKWADAALYAAKAAGRNGVACHPGEPPPGQGGARDQDPAGAR